MDTLTQGMIIGLVIAVVVVLTAAAWWKAIKKFGWFKAFAFPIVTVVAAGLGIAGTLIATGTIEVPQIDLSGININLDSFRDIEFSQANLMSFVNWKTMFGFGLVIAIIRELWNKRVKRALVPLFFLIWFILIDWLILRSPEHLTIDRIAYRGAGTFFAVLIPALFISKVDEMWANRGKTMIWLLVFLGIILLFSYLIFGENMKRTLNNLFFPAETEAEEILEIAEPEVDITTQPTEAALCRTAVRNTLSTSAIMREEPNIESTNMGSVARGQEVEILRETPVNNEWTRVRVNDLTGWMANFLLVNPDC